MAIENGRYICCPVCSGKGQLHRSELIEQLSDPERDQKIKTYLERITQEQEKEGEAAAAADEPGAYERELHTWPPKRMLLRRSPKE